MTPFEYVSVLLSMVVSLALAHLLIGITRIIKAGVSRWSIPMLGWIGFMIFLCIDYWFSVWAARNDPVWSLGFVCFLLVLGAVLFVGCWMIGFQSTAVKLLGLVQIGLVATAWTLESPRVQTGVVAVMWVLMTWYALIFIPAL
jgi:hypothetical protein